MAIGPIIALHFILKKSVSIVNPRSNLAKFWFLRVYSTSLLKTLWKQEIARNEQFLLYPQLKLLSGNTLNLAETKFCRLGKG